MREENGNAALELWTRVNSAKINESARTSQKLNKPLKLESEVPGARLTISCWRAVVNLKRECVDFYFLNYNIFARENNNSERTCRDQVMVNAKTCSTREIRLENTRATRTKIQTRAIWSQALVFSSQHQYFTI